MNALVFLGLAALAPAAPSARAAVTAAASNEIEAKVALESSLERRLETVLKQVLGTADVVVIVNADMLTDAERKAIEVMPGVPPKELSEAAAPLAVAPTLVRKMTATVFLDQGAPDAQRSLAQSTVERLLGIAPGSGAVTIEPTVFRRPEPEGAGAAARAAAAPPPPAFDRRAWVAPGAWLAFGLLALLVLYARFLAPLLGVLRELSAAARLRGESLAPQAGAGFVAPSAAAPLAPAAIEAPAPSKELSTEVSHFGFIRERDLGALAFLLQRDPTSAAIVLNYLPPALGSRFLDQLPLAVRQDVAGLMTQTRLLNKHQVNLIEEGLRERLQYLMGGESRLAEILDGANAQLQTEMLEALRERDPEAAGRLARRIVMLDDLALLEEPDFKALSRLVTVQSLAAVLAASPRLKERVLPRLSGGVSEWLTQEIELCPPLAAEQLEAEQRKVLVALSKAVREGKIVLRKDVEEPPAPALEEPSAPAAPATEIVPRAEAA